MFIKSKGENHVTLNRATYMDDSRITLLYFP